MNLSGLPTSSSHLTLDSVGFGVLPPTSGTPFSPSHSETASLAFRSLSQLPCVQEAILENQCYLRDGTHPGPGSPCLVENLKGNQCRGVLISRGPGILGIPHEHKGQPRGCLPGPVSLQVRNKSTWQFDMVFFFLFLEDMPWLLGSLRHRTMLLPPPGQKSCRTLSQEPQGPLLEPRNKKTYLVLAQLSKTNKQKTHLSLILVNIIIFYFLTLLLLSRTG